MQKQWSRHPDIVLTFISQAASISARKKTGDQLEDDGENQNKGTS